MKSNFVISPIGKLSSPLKQKFGTPRQPNLAAVESTIIFNAPYDNPDAFLGIEEFSHIWLLWQFSQVVEKSNELSEGLKPFRAQVRPPRLGGYEKVGVFASRSPYRPNHLGLSVVELKEVVVENGKARLVVLGADLVDGTPIFDIKPYVAYSDSILDAKSGFAPDPPKPKLVLWSEKAQIQFLACAQQNKLTQADKKTITELVALDPRPAFDSVKQQKPYKMRFKEVDVVFSWAGDSFWVNEINDVN